MKKKKLPYILLAIVVMLIGILIVLLTLAGGKEETQENETQSVLFGVDVTNLQTRGVERMKSVSDDTIYSRKLTKDNVELDIAALKTESYASAVYEFEKLYKGGDSELYERLNTKQLDEDSVTEFSFESLESYLTDTLGEAESVTIFPLKTYRNEKKGYIIVELCSATKTAGITGNALYDYDTAKKARFTFWLEDDGFSYVPYSVIEGVPVEIQQDQQAMPSVVPEEQDVPINDTERATKGRKNKQKQSAAT